ncbi:putative dna-directed rna polymerase ii subunit rpb1 [Lyophyllum shimeji]|uniref:Dna-directed rna polymerase ii subunit rpb1 n=1 Tax=Lyophyllum shimeji TaxID=47721 RepID=A0A9P3PMY5_LYOSH|nr:putative dna-directed rna polymerase ii subunit rpb1 [Lyophyllum shimeji]
MPLDGHAYLVSQGWAGKGTGLRQGAISRPLAIPQKKDLAGLGKDRDEAFPFWDHLFSAAAKSIQLKVTSDDDEAPDGGSSTTEFKRTATGIFSNRRPLTGVSASTSGTSTPILGDNTPRSSLLSIAKREAAKSSLYARFFRGPVLGPDNDTAPLQAQEVAEVVVGPTAEPSSAINEKGKQKHDGEEAVTSDRKRKRDAEDDAERRQRKKERKERKAQKIKEKEERRESKAQKAKEKEEKKARRRERKAAKEAGQSLTLEEIERRERKKLKRALQDKDQEVCRLENHVSKKERKKSDGAASCTAENVELPNGQAQGYRTHLPDNELEEGVRKKKRKRKED